MSDVLITSEYFGKFSNAGKDILKNAGLAVQDPFGHKFIQPIEIIKHSLTADAFICDLELINREVIDSSPKLKVISRRGVGVDSVDVKYAQRKGIAVTRTMGVVEPPVAELVMSYILEFSRNISRLSKDMHDGIWEKKECHSVNRKILGIVGMGKIAYEVATRAHAFGMKIVYFDINTVKDAEDCFGARQVALDELLEISDFITIHTPLNDETKGMFNYQVISKMKRNAYLINTARGAIINEVGLCKAIDKKKIAGAAIDVFDIEPNTTSMLRGFNNVILTPHVGTFTREVFIEMDILAAENVVRVLKERDKNVIA